MTRFSMPGPSFELTEGEKLMQLKEMFPSHTQDELQEDISSSQHGCNGSPCIIYNCKK